MHSREIRRKFLDYFKAKGHEIVESASLIPKDDPSLLFTNAGMVPFKMLFLGEEQRGYTRAASSQKCVRAGGKHNDLENVGYTPRHHTFFEMLGNFSFGDYFKEEAIAWAWELLIEGFKLPRERLYVSVYKDDDEAYRIWEEEIGVVPERIVRLGEKDNFWAMGDTGPCGPCSEIHMDQGPSMGCDRKDCRVGCDCDRYLEIWNLVFTQFDRSADGLLTPLPKPNIDTGMGLERLAAVVQGVTSNYDTDLFKDLIALTEDLSERSYGENKKQDVAFRVISDHARAITFLIGDGIMPSNEGRGYVLRRIIRRAIRFGQTLALNDPFLSRVCSKVIDVMGGDYEELLRSKHFIEGVVSNEEKRFADTLHYSMKVLGEEIEKLKAQGRDIIQGEVAFKLYDTYGLSLDIVEDVARDEDLHVDLSGYEKAMTRQRTLSQESWKGSGEDEIPEVFRNLQARGVTSRFVGHETLSSKAEVVAMIVEGLETESAEAGSEAEVVLNQTPFYGQAGGQVGDVGRLRKGKTRFSVIETLRFGQDLIVHKGYLEKGSFSIGDEVDALVSENERSATARNHSATHLLHGALRSILGDHVKQAGSLVSPQRLRFDFSHFTQVVEEKLFEVEGLVNKHIRDNLPIQKREMSKEEALKTGAMAIFEERYGKRVRLVSMGDDVSMELCGGTHCARTGDIGLFRIVSEGAVAANVRRIEALTGDRALTYDQKQDAQLKLISSLLKTTPDKAGERIGGLLKEHREKIRETADLRAKILAGKSERRLSGEEDPGGGVTGVREIGGIKVFVDELEADSPKELRESADRIKDRLGSGIVLLGAKKEGKVMLACVVTKDLIDRFKAGDMIKGLSVMVGGKGGGRPDMAQGGGNKPENLKAALEAFYGLVEEKIN
ncbi:MAG: alanine--tRNA ligase [Deltaproteobacteria bacterium]|nr:alanine--tRNA ligase [Deltaproteobacteria bacterium]